MTSHTCSFSLRRIALLYEFNAPWLRKQTVIYLIVSLIAALVFLLGHGQMWQMGVYGMLGMVITFMFILAPIVFVKGGDSRIVDRLIPASTPEKFVFYLSYLCVVIGAACFLLPYLAEKIYPSVFSFDGRFEKLVEVERDVPDPYRWSHYMAVVAAMVTCLYCVLGARGGRVVKAYIWPIVVEVIFSTLGTIFGVKEAFMAGYNEAAGVVPVADGPELAGKVTLSMNVHATYSYTVIAIMAVYTLLMLWLSYRAIYRKNI